MWSYIHTNKLLRGGALPFTHIAVQPFNDGRPVKACHGVGLCHEPWFCRDITLKKQTQ